MSQEQSAGSPERKTAGDLRLRNAPALFAGLVLILLGVLLLLQTQGWLAAHDWWKLFLMGLGVIFIVDALVRLGRPGWAGRLVIGLVLLPVGLIFIAGFDRWWPLILVIIGAGVIVRKFVR